MNSPVHPYTSLNSSLSLCFSFVLCNSLYEFLKRSFFNYNIFLSSGERSNQCPSGFQLDPAGPYCAGTVRQYCFYCIIQIIVSICEYTRSSFIDEILCLLVLFLLMKMRMSVWTETPAHMPATILLALTTVPVPEDSPSQLMAEHARVRKLF